MYNALTGTLLLVTGVPTLASAPSAGFGGPARPFNVAHEQAIEIPRMVLFDQPGDGSLWAYGSNWKMSFEAGAAT